MDFISATIRPGVVLSVDNETGIIKASAPGLFSAEDPIDSLPPIYPWAVGPSNQYSQPEEGEEVWILNNESNPLQLHWFRKDQALVNNTDLNLSGETDVEVICNRANGMGWASIYFSDGSGWVISNNGSSINLKKDGSIVMGTGLPKQTISISGQGISLGTEGKSKYSAVLGEELIDVLNQILSTLGKVGKVASANPYTAAIGAVLTPLPTQVAQSVSGILSSNVTLE